MKDKIKRNNEFTTTAKKLKNEAYVLKSGIKAKDYELKRLKEIRNKNYRRCYCKLELNRRK